MIEPTTTQTPVRQRPARHGTPAARASGGEPRFIEGGDLLSVPGLSGGAVHCGLKNSGELDLAVVRAERPLAAAGVFTRSLAPAAPVLLDRRRLAERPEVRSLVVNAGNANATTGARGERDAAEMVERLEERCGGPALVLSTGIIGVPLPMDRVRAGIDAAAARCTPEGGQAVARAMLTTDTRTKTAAAAVTLPGGATVRVGGVAKGSGMIHPDMATMLAVMATDAPVRPDLLRGVLSRAVDRSFHEITVDGDTSTNDSVLLLAGGAPLPELQPGDERLAALEAGVRAVADNLARQIVADGEGASRVMELHVTGAASEARARQVARTVAGSLLVKTALAGGDPNWGRILAAAARAGVPLDPGKLSLSLGGIRVFAAGLPLAVDPEPLARAFSADEVTVELDLGQGEARARMLTCDLTHGYVTINAEYHT